MLIRRLTTHAFVDQSAKVHLELYLVSTTPAIKTAASFGMLSIKFLLADYLLG